jgi:hypothetical protein
MLELYRAQGHKVYQEPTNGKWYVLMDQPCQHYMGRGKGCALYGTGKRPEICRDYVCGDPGNMHERHDKLIEKGRQPMTQTVYASICSRNTAYWNMVTAFQMAANHLGKNTGVMCKLAPYVGDSLISRARCISMANFLESDSDWLLTLDDDIELPEDGLTKLLEADKDCIGGIYRLKGKMTSNPYAIRWQPGQQVDIDEIAEVTYLSTGCMLYKRSFIEDLVSKYPDLYFNENMTDRQVSALYMPYIYNGEYLSEDWAFCQRAMDVGYKMYVHGGVHCVHWGMAPFKIEDLTLEDKTF